MSVLVYIEVSEGQVKKSSLEAAVYGSKVAEKLGTKAEALYIGTESAPIGDLGKYGISRVIHVDDAELKQFSILAYADAFKEVAQKSGAKVFVFAKSSSVDAIVARVGVALQANIATNVVDLPSTDGGFTVKRSVFTGKAFATASLTSENKILVIKKNAVNVEEKGASVAVEKLDVNLSVGSFAIKTVEVQKASGQVLLPEAEIVVSAGRGLKGPENWGMIESLAKTLGAATGCSKPVSDMDWRPHHEHVGQTGVKVSPNLYIAIGISGAIQHLAGVNSSRCIVVINKDPEAPFFKAADYGIVGDAFEIVPKLEAALKA